MPNKAWSFMWFHLCIYLYSCNTAPCGSDSHSVERHDDLALDDRGPLLNSVDVWDESWVFSCLPAARGRGSGSERLVSHLPAACKAAREDTCLARCTIALCLVLSRFTKVKWHWPAVKKRVQLCQGCLKLAGSENQSQVPQSQTFHQMGSENRTHLTPMVYHHFPHIFSHFQTPKCAWTFGSEWLLSAWCFRARPRNRFRFRRPCGKPWA